MSCIFSYVHSYFSDLLVSRQSIVIFCKMPLTWNVELLEKRSWSEVVNEWKQRDTSKHPFVGNVLNVRQHVHREKDYIVASHILIHFAIDCCNKVVTQRFCILLLPTKWDSPQFRLADVCMKELEADGNTTEAGYWNKDKLMGSSCSCKSVIVNRVWFSG